MTTYPRVLVCTQYDEAQQVCVQQEWAYTMPLLPPLSVPDAVLLGSTLLALWALAYSGRVIERAIRGR